jgi:FkbM family methyltransferase
MKPDHGGSPAVSRRAIGFVFRPWIILGICLELVSRTCKTLSGSTLRRGDTVYDIGANIGYVSLSLVKSVGPRGRVVAFEPVPKNVDYLRASVKINHLPNVQVMEFAASDQCGEAVIRIAENLSTASLVWHRKNPSATQLTIRTVQIDQLVESGELRYPKFVKIDVEGAEGSVLKGMERTVGAARPVLFIECSEAGREAT